MANRSERNHPFDSCRPLLISPSLFSSDEFIAIFYPSRAIRKLLQASYPIGPMSVKALPTTRAGFRKTTVMLFSRWTPNSASTR